MSSRLNVNLSAHYSSPTGKSQSFSHSLAAEVTTIKQKTEYLASLRESLTRLQNEVNAFLTVQMDEDKATAAGAGARVDDRAEEENYGEEKV